jgi:hypothetical protein
MPVDFPPDTLDAFPAMQTEQVTPTGIAVVTMVHENLVVNFKRDLSPKIDLPSIWRLANHVVNERGPLLVFRFKEPEK